MKRIALALIFAGCLLAMSAQDVMKVKFSGAKPTITDLAWAFLFSDDDEEEDDECDSEATAGIKDALTRYRQGRPQEEDVKLTVDNKAGYILYEWRYENYYSKIEMCFWNEADKKHKLFAYNRWLFKDGKPTGGQYDGLIFCRYTNSSRTMQYCEAPCFDTEFFNTSYTLPRIGKNIIMTKWLEDGTKAETTLKWNGHGFAK